MAGRGGTSKSKGSMGKGGGRNKEFWPKYLPLPFSPQIWFVR